MRTVGAIVAAAGTGSRLGRGSKALVRLNGRTTLARVLELFLALDEVDRIVVVGPPSRLESAEREVEALHPRKPVIVKAGGESLDRSLIVLAQTPQGFAYDLLARAHREAADAGLVGDDDAQLVAATGHLVSVVPGEPANLKLTTPEDLEVVEALIREHETAVR